MPGARSGQLECGTHLHVVKAKKVAVAGLVCGREVVHILDAASASGNSGHSERVCCPSLGAGFCLAFLGGA